MPRPGSTQVTGHRRDRRAPVRTEGFAPIRDYAVIGDGRTAALVALDGSIDWLCLPDVDSPSVFGALLDPERGGTFRLTPEVPFTAERRYLPHSNVLETTFFTAEGVLRVTDGMTLPLDGLAPARELGRRVEGLSGAVPVRWGVQPRFGYAESRTRIERRSGVPVAIAGANALAVCSWGAGAPDCTPVAVAGRFLAREGERVMLALSAAHSDPLVIPSRGEVEGRLDGTSRFWADWAAQRRYEGPWRDAVLRSVLALKLLIYAPSGAIAAAATTSLPETLAGERNWDYRFAWIRDAAFTLDALIRVGCPTEADAFFWWLLHASQLTQPELRVLYRLDGRVVMSERELSFPGYRGSRPVRAGNQAAAQRQLDIYGHLLQTTWLYVSAGGALPSDAARRIAKTADLVCRIWREPDSGIWEVRSEPTHFTESKMMCWSALDRALALAEDGHIPDRSAATWRAEAERIRSFVEERCWSEELRSYTRAAGLRDLDASLLLGGLFGYERCAAPRLATTIERIRRELGNGPLLHRYRGGDGLRGDEGAFLACSFWLVDALTHLGRLEEAGELMEELLALANDVGLYAEEIDPEGGEFLGNFPQGLVHLALVNAAATLAERGAR